MYHNVTFEIEILCGRKKVYFLQQNT